MPMPKEVIDQVRKQVAEAEAIIKDIEPEVNRAILAGIPAEAQKKELEDLKKKVGLLKLHYGI